jgi:hypothetical protein
MAVTVKKQKPSEADTTTLLAQAHAHLAAIDVEIAELDGRRLDIDPAEAVKAEIELAAARNDALRRIALLEERAGQELRQRQTKAQEALRGRVENKFSERDHHIEKMCAHMADMIAEMKLAVAANGAAAAAWPWDGVRDNEPCLFGLFLRAAIRHELYRLSGDPYESATNRGSFDFPGAECPTPFRDLNPNSVQPLTEKAKAGSAYASRIMREAPIRVLPPVVPPPKPVEVKPAEAAPTVTVEKAEQQPPKAAEPEYLWRVQFKHRQTGEQRTEEVLLGPAELEESSLDGLGATGPRAREIATRIATERAGPEFVFESVAFDMNRLIESMNRD